MPLEQSSTLARIVCAAIWLAVTAITAWTITKLPRYLRSHFRIL
jgi:hypothetical protein